MPINPITCMRIFDELRRLPAWAENVSSPLTVIVLPLSVGSLSFTLLITSAFRGHAMPSNGTLFGLPDAVLMETMRFPSLAF